MLKVATAALIGIGAASPALANDHARCAPVTQQDVEAQFDRFNQAWATGNPDTVTALFTRDAVLLPTVSNRPRTDHEGIRDYFVGFLKGAPVGRIDTGTVKLGCNQAARLGTWTVTLTDPTTGAQTPVAARYSFIYRYENGQWLIDHLHSSMMPEPAAN
ncbi:MAG: SgcJ/EcaC family oxidoreductase [Allosphingosinicella sp.]|uniref:SgcJ/EcaC family oxidoreductase n=1 Tax=Allosphingosinicella sp. TaxID=2823234 RepID=UPI00393E1D6C